MRIYLVDAAVAAAKVVGIMEVIGEFIQVVAIPALIDMPTPPTPVASTGQ